MSTKKQLMAAIREINPKADEQNLGLDALKKSELQAIFDELTNGDDAGQRGMAKTLAKYRETYKPSVSPSGRKSLNNGDPIAQILEGRDADEVLAIAEQLLELNPGELVARYENLNPGQRRMNGGNRIRSAIKRGDHTIKELEAAVQH